MKGIIITQALKDKNKLFEKRDGFYAGSLPNKFWGTERIIGGYAGRTDLHKTDGWYDIVVPTPLAGEKLGERYFDATNEVWTYYVIPKTPEDLAQEAASKKQMDQQKIKEAKVNAYVESQLTVAEKVTWYPEWVSGKAYAINEKVSYKGKPFNNTVVGNINAPDKGGWTEIK